MQVYREYRHFSCFFYLYKTKYDIDHKIMASSIHPSKSPD